MRDGKDGAGFNTFLVLVLVIGIGVIGFFIGALIRDDDTTGAIVPDRSRRGVGWVQVEPRTPWDPRGKPRDDFVDWGGLQIDLKTHANLLTSSTLFASVLSDAHSPIRQTAWFKSQPDVKRARRWLEARFRAEPVKDSKLICVYVAEPGMSGKDAKTIVESIVASHVEAQRKHQTDRMLDRTQTLNNLRTKYETRQKVVTDRRNNRILQLNIGQVGAPGRYTATDLELHDSVSRFIELRAQQAAAKAEYDQLLQDIQAGDEPPELRERIDSDPQLRAAQARVDDLAVEIKVATETGKDAAVVKELTIRRDTLSEQLVNARAEKIAHQRTAILHRAQTKLRAATEAAEDVQKRIDNLKGVLGDLAIAMSDYLTANDELESLALTLKDLREQLEVSGSSVQPQVALVQAPISGDNDLPD